MDITAQMLQCSLCNANLDLTQMLVDLKLMATVSLAQKIRIVLFMV